MSRWKIFTSSQENQKTWKTISTTASTNTNTTNTTHTHLNAHEWSLMMKTSHWNQFRLKGTDIQ